MWIYGKLFFFFFSELTFTAVEIFSKGERDFHREQKEFSFPRKKGLLQKKKKKLWRFTFYRWALILYRVPCLIIQTRVWRKGLSKGLLLHFETVEISETYGSCKFSGKSLAEGGELKTPSIMIGRRVPAGFEEWLVVFIHSAGCSFSFQLESGEGELPCPPTQSAGI